MKRNKLKDGLYTVGFMFIVTLVTTSSISALHYFTADIVKRNESLYIQTAILRAAGIDIPAGPVEISRRYDELVTPDQAVSQSYTVGEGAVRRVFVRSGPGLWGDIAAAVCVDMADQSLVGVTFIAHNETPGLGARIEEPWFQRQFSGKRGQLELVPEGTGSESADRIDAITGATITSRAVRDIVNRTLEEAARMVPGQKSAEQ